MKNLIKLFLILTAFTPVSALYADSTGKALEITITIRDGSNDNPMMALWLETDNGDFVRTLHMYSKRKVHYGKLKGWASKSKETETPADVDAVSGATLGWNQSSRVSIPAQIGTTDLLSGKYVLRIESRTHFGENSRSLTIPLPEDYTGSVFEDIGSMKSVDIKVKDKAD